jgi:transposase
MNIAKALKQQHNIKTLIHPAQSLDLNPIEACWNIIKPRVRKRTWRTLAELREII